MTDANPTNLEAADSLVEDTLRRVLTWIPGNVISFDDGAGVRPPTVEVQIARKLSDLDGRTEAIAPIPNVPIAWPAFGPFALWGDLEAGDELMLGIPCRSISEWLDSNGLHDPAHANLFELADAIASPVSMTTSKRYTATGGAFKLGRRDDTAVVTIKRDGEIVIEAGSIKLGGGATAKVARDGDDCLPSAALVAWANLIAASPAAVPSPWTAGVLPAVGSVKASSSKVESE